MKKISTTIKNVDGTLMVPIPEAIAELMDFNEGDNVKVPFHEIEKYEEFDDPYLSAPLESGVREVTVDIRENPSKKITQEDVIKVLNSPTPDIEVYRTAYISWKGKRYGIKKVSKKVFGFDDFNTVQAERYLNELGFVTFRE